MATVHAQDTADRALCDDSLGAGYFRFQCDKGINLAGHVRRRDGKVGATNQRRCTLIRVLRIGAHKDCRAINLAHDVHNALLLQAALLQTQLVLGFPDDGVTNREFSVAIVVIDVLRSSASNKE